MEASHFVDKCIAPSIRYSLAHPPPALSRFSISISKSPVPGKGNSRRLIHRRSGIWASNSDTLVAGSKKGDGKHREIVGRKEEESGDLKSWMHKNGLPPCKIVLKERPSQSDTHKPIRYVAASEDLQVRSLNGWPFWLFLE